MMASEAYELPDILKTVEAWESYRGDWLASLAKSKTVPPAEETIANFRNVWLAAYLKGRADSNKV